MAWQVQGLTAALEYLHRKHQADPNYGTHGFSEADMMNIAGVMTDEVVRRIVEFLRRSSTTSTRQTGQHVDPNVQAQQFNVLQPIENNLQQIEARATSSAFRGRAQSLIAEAMNVDHMDLHRRQSGRTMDQYPDPGMPHIEEVFDVPPLKDKSMSPRRKPSFTGTR